MINISQSNVDKALESLSGIKNGMGKALSRALNHTMKKAKTQIKRKTASNYFISQSEVDKTLKIRKATWTNLNSTITSKSKILGLDKFKVSVKNGVVRAAVSKIEGYKNRPGGFVSNVKSFSGGSWRKENNKNIFTPNFSSKKGAMIFKRVGSSKYPIKRLHGASVPGMIGNKDVIDSIESFVYKESKKRLDHEVGRILGGFR